MDFFRGIGISNYLAYPKVLEAAVIAIPHDKYMERPLAVVVPLKEHEDAITKEEIYKFLETKVFFFYFDLMLSSTKQVALRWPSGGFQTILFLQRYPKR